MKFEVRMARCVFTPEQVTHYEALGFTFEPADAEYFPGKFNTVIGADITLEFNTFEELMQFVADYDPVVLYTDHIIIYNDYIE